MAPRRVRACAHRTSRSPRSSRSRARSAGGRYAAGGAVEPGRALEHAVALGRAAAEAQAFLDQGWVDVGGGQQGDRLAPLVPEPAVRFGGHGPSGTAGGGRPAPSRRPGARLRRRARPSSTRSAAGAAAPTCPAARGPTARERAAADGRRAGAGGPPEVRGPTGNAGRGRAPGSGGRSRRRPARPRGSPAGRPADGPRRSAIIVGRIASTDPARTGNGWGPVSSS